MVGDISCPIVHDSPPELAPFPIPPFPIPAMKWSGVLFWGTCGRDFTRFPLYRTFLRPLSRK